MRFRPNASSIEALPSPAICSAVSARPWPCCETANRGLGGAVSQLLITGGAGFIGANFVLYWRRLHPNDLIVVLDALTYAGNRANLDAMQGDKQFEFVHGDICDARLVQSLFRRHDFDLVVHFAAESHVDRSIVSSAPSCGPMSLAHTRFSTAP